MQLSSNFVKQLRCRNLSRRDFSANSIKLWRCLITSRADCRWVSRDFEWPNTQWSGKNRSMATGGICHPHLVRQAPARLCPHKVSLFVRFQRKCRPNDYISRFTNTAGKIGRAIGPIWRYNSSLVGNVMVVYRRFEMKSVAWRLHSVIK